MVNLKNKTVALGLSGGVDSAVSALLLKQQGYKVTGVYIECWNEPGCRAEQDRKDALKTALELNIEFKELDFRQAYKEGVLQYFLDEYKSGRTPNPDVMCNKIIKFGLFYQWAIKNGFDYIATGHYAQIVEEDKHCFLATSIDERKDQTYFLYQLNEEKLSRILFPIGHFTKSQVRQMAKDNHLSVSDKKDSVGICFVGQIDVHKFLKDNLGENPGEIVDVDGKILGRHQGLWFYTIGQRQGLEIDHKKLLERKYLANNKSLVPALFVIGKNQKKNQLIVGLKQSVSTNIFFIQSIKTINQIDKNVLMEQDLLVRIRHTGELIPCRLKVIDDEYQVNLKKPADGIAAGQSAVIYQKRTKNIICLGGGIISSN